MSTRVTSCSFEDGGRTSRSEWRPDRPGRDPRHSAAFFRGPTRLVGERIDVEGRRSKRNIDHYPVVAWDAASGRWWPGIEGCRCEAVEGADGSLQPPGEVEDSCEAPRGGSIGADLIRRDDRRCVRRRHRTPCSRRPAATEPPLPLPEGDVRRGAGILGRDERHRLSANPKEYRARLSTSGRRDRSLGSPS